MIKLLHAEWTKLRTVRGWMIALVVAAAAVVGLGLLAGGQGSCGRNGPGSECVLPVGPGGEEVVDRFGLVHRPLTGDGTLTVRVRALTGLLPPRPDGREEKEGGSPRQAAPGAGGEPGLAPWAKAGLIIKDGTSAGSTYAAVMLTGAHGVRMQHDFVHDRAGADRAEWLRLTRSGPTITGEQSADGTSWTTVGTVRLDGLPATAEVGLFATSPQHTWLSRNGVGMTDATGGPSFATGTFDSITLGGAWQNGPWTRTAVGGDDGSTGDGDPATGEVSVTGSGDIAPAVSGLAGLGTTISQTLTGTFAGLIVVVVLGAMVMTAEYRSGLVRTSFAAMPGRGRVLAAKAVVLGGTTFAVGTVAAVIVVFAGQRVLRANGVYLHPVSTAAEVRVIAGTGALLAGAALLSLALGTVLRRSLTAVTTGIVVIVLPYLLALTVLPTVAAEWLLRVTPAAAFALQGTAPRYPQVENFYLPANGYFPLPPWAGLAVLAAWTALALTAATIVLRRRDA
jgi:ABC-type transport system involved in multi-copper enzyme maturation permease subunit